MATHGESMDRRSYTVLRSKGTNSIPLMFILTFCARDNQLRMEIQLSSLSK